MAAIKSFIMLARRPDLSQEAFSRHWREIHGPLAAGMPEVWKYSQRYVQNHLVRPLFGNGLAGGISGVAESWQRPRADSGNFLDEPRYMEVLRPDELKFLDLEACAVLLTEERVTLDGPEATIKLLGFVNDAAARALARVERARRRDENRVLKDRGRSLQPTAASVDCDLCVELWFDDLADAERALGDVEANLAAAGPGSIYLVATHEFRPRGAAAAAAAG
jgi:hypothetical protein